MGLIAIVAMAGVSTFSAEVRAKVLEHAACVRDLDCSPRSAGSVAAALTASDATSDTGASVAVRAERPSRPETPPAAPVGAQAPADIPEGKYEFDLLVWEDVAPTRWAVGPPRRPDIQHDNGFLDTEKPRPPTLGDRAAKFAWVARLAAARAIQGIPGVPHNDIPDAIATYHHFLFGKGKDFQFSYERYVRMDEGGKATLERAMWEAATVAEEVAKLEVEERAAAGAPAPSLRFQIRSSPLSQNYYPQTENWQKAIGGHPVWVTADVVVDRAGDTSRLTMEMTLHAEDRYNFIPLGGQDVATGISDSDNGRFEVTGQARQFLSKSTLERRFSWELGQTPLAEPPALAGEDVAKKRGDGARPASEKTSAFANWAVLRNKTAWDQLKAKEQASSAPPAPTSAPP